MSRNDSKEYVFKKPIIKTLAYILDTFFSLFFRKHCVDEPTDPSTIAIIRIDNIGDVAISSLFLKQAREKFPTSKIVFITSSAGRDMILSTRLVDEVIAVDVPWFSNKRNPWAWPSKIMEMEQILRTTNANLVYDLRGDVRHIWASWRALPKAFLVSYGITGGGSLLNRCTKYLADVHAAEANANHLAIYNATLDNVPSGLSTQELDKAVANMLTASDKLKIVLHVGAGTESKMWNKSSWVKIVNNLVNDLGATVIWIGDDDALKNVRLIEKELSRDVLKKCINVCNKIKLGQLNNLLRECKLLISCDSGPVHIASSEKIPSLVLFSGANESRLWRPINRNARIIEHSVSCSPCHLKKCKMPTHECMDLITTESVYNEIKEMIA